MLRTNADWAHAMRCQRRRVLHQGQIICRIMGAQREEEHRSDLRRVQRSFLKQQKDQKRKYELLLQQQKALAEQNLEERIELDERR